MLKSLRLKNFQKFASFRLEFSPTLTTIIGSSDSGKSALFRSIQWVVLNKPTGTGFRKHGSNDTRARLETEEHRVDRSRIGSDNSYSLDGEKYKSFGSGVPEDVQKALGSMDSMNFQSQHDPLFWFTLSPSQLSAEINKLVDLDSIDYVNKKLRALEKNSVWLIDGYERRVAEHEASLVELEALDHIEVMLNQIEKRTEQLEALDLEYSDLEEAQESFQSLTGRVRVLSQARKGLEELAKLESELLELDRYYGQLCVLLNDWKRATMEINSLKQEQTKAAASEKKCPTCGKPL